MLIRVTQKHIEQGDRCNSQRCMVALAILDAAPALHWVSVSQAAVRFQRASGARIETIVFSAEVRERIARFDDYGRVVPFEFDLAL